jgi:hypothetical protein
MAVSAELLGAVSIPTDLAEGVESSTICLGQVRFQWYIKGGSEFASVSPSNSWVNLSIVMEESRWFLQ